MRWRSTGGYGVHSPLAYRIVRNAVKPSRGVVYYGEERLGDYAERRMHEGKERISAGELRRARLLLRLVAELQPSYVWISAGAPEIFSEAVRLAGSAIRLYDGKIFPAKMDEADMIVGVGWKRNATLPTLAPGMAFIGFDLPEKVAEKIKGSLEGGVVLDGAGSLIAVRTADRAVHQYNISKF